MENIKTKERRDKDWVCRVWLQIKYCRQCLFDNFCSFEDRKNDLLNNQNKNDQDTSWGTSNWED